MSWKPVVQVGGESKWSENGLRFATHAEALQSAKDLMNRWMLVTACDAHESDDPVNYTINRRDDGQLAMSPIQKEAA